MVQNTLHRNDYELVETCGACPEQYDVLLDGEIVGYLRLRHGYFSVSYPGVGGEEVYRATPDGDGIFESYERNRYLNEAIAAIDKRHHEGAPAPEEGPDYNQAPEGWTYR